jgi:hypothetical protein
MAILWTKEDGTTRTSHEGLVMSVGERDWRAMSDVYATQYFARVWDEAKKVETTVTLGSNFELDNGERGTATVDFDHDREDYQEFLAKAKARADEELREEQLRLKQDREDRAMRICLYENLGKGDRVRVVKGRKVKKGTEGTIFWTGAGTYGPRCGFKEDGAAKDDAHWTALSNLVRILPDVPHGTTPEGGWTAYLEAKEKVAAAAAAKLPKKGEWVALKADNGATYGKVFWVKGERLGFKLKKADEPTWANADDVVVMTGDPRKGGKPRDPVATEEAAEERKSGLEEMPWPYCAIKTLKVEDGTWKAYDADGNFLLDMPAGAAAQVMERLAAA